MPVAEEPLIIRDVFLQPGEFVWTDQNNRIKTLLGSCVAIVLYNAEKNIGGMCHIMLPEKKDFSAELNGKYATDVIKMFLKEIEKSKTKPSDYTVKIFGGSNMFTAHERHIKDLSENVVRKSINEIGQKNVNKAKELLALHRFNISGESTLGSKHRKIYFNLWNGEVWMEMKKG